MRLARTIALGTTAFGLGATAAAGNAFAGEGDFGMNDSVILLEPVDVVHVYGIDENRDGVVDAYLFLEESDTRG